MQAVTANSGHGPAATLPGSHIAISGNSTSSPSSTNMMRWNGIVPSTTSLSLPFQMLWMTNRLMPIGGEIWPDLDEQHQDDAEPDRIDAVLQQHRIEQRHGDHDHAEAFDQAAEHRVEHEQRDEEFQPRQFQLDQKLRDLLADAGIG